MPPSPEGRVFFRLLRDPSGDANRAAIGCQDIVTRYRSQALPGYNKDMARGWESKSVEEQMEAAASARPSGAQPPLDTRQAERLRLRQGLELSRSRVRQQLAGDPHPRHRRLLEGALADLEAQLARLG